jgi:hypothetical protein
MRLPRPAPMLAVAIILSLLSLLVATDGDGSS